jgi:hypothetical protein
VTAIMIIAHEIFNCKQFVVVLVWINPKMIMMKKSG